MRTVLDSQLQEAARLATRATQLDDSDPWAHLALGFVAIVRRQTNVATAEFRRALALNPNFAAAHGYLGWALAFHGQSEEAAKTSTRSGSHEPARPAECDL
jgi:Flp pilus assembly protein TadD